MSFFLSFTNQAKQDLKKLNMYWTHIHNARALIEKNAYKQAEQEYILAINVSRSDGDVWMARALLKDLHIRGTQYLIRLVFRGHNT